jgi:hypothetical protein
MKINTEPIGSIPRPLKLIEAIATRDVEDPSLAALQVAFPEASLEAFPEEDRLVAAPFPEEAFQEEDLEDALIVADLPSGVPVVELRHLLLVQPDVLVEAEGERPGVVAGAADAVTA